MATYRVPTRGDWAATALLLAAFVAVIVTGAALIATRHPAGFLLVAGALLILVVRWHAGNFAYRCPECGHEFEISTLTDFISPHMLSTKYLRCPACGRRSWATVLKKTSPGPVGVL